MPQPAPSDGILIGHIDAPSPLDPCDGVCLVVRGWVHAGVSHSEISRIEVIAGDRLAGESFVLGPRPDVCAAHGLDAATCTGFEVLCHVPDVSAGASVQLDTLVHFRGDPSGRVLDRRTVRLVETDYTKADFGIVLDPNFVSPLKREHVYVSGPSNPKGSAECLALIQKFAGPAPKRILDVGCGLGPYARPLIESGHSWHGAETKAGDCAELARQGLPHTRVDGLTLPFPDRSFDCALAIEVLEHIETPGDFLREIRRVSPQILVSVPNFEPVPYLRSYLAAPWHVLEADHKNFYTRWSLKHELARWWPKVEVAAYGEYPVRSKEGTPLFYHLFASAWA